MIQHAAECFCTADGGADALQGACADKAGSFTDEEAAQKEELSITLYLDNDAFPQTTIKLYRYDGSTCLATVDGKSVALVPRSRTVNLIEAVNAIVPGK